MGSAGQALVATAEATSQYIDGRFRQGEGAAFPVVNPSDASVIATVRESSSDQVKAAIGAARKAFDSGVWSGLPARERAAILRRFAGALQARAAAPSPTWWWPRPAVRATPW